MTSAAATAIQWVTSINGMEVTLTLSSSSVKRDEEAQREQELLLLNYLKVNHA